MKENTFIALLTVACIGIEVVSLLGIVVFGASVTTSTIDNSGRREYGYCPVDPTTISSRANLEINGCPLIRAYVTNWSELLPIDQQTIDTQMRALGFKDIGEFDNRVK